MAGAPVLIKLPYPPSVNNSSRVGRDRAPHRTDKAKTWFTEAVWLVKAAMGRRKPFEGPVAVKFVVHRPDRRRRDLSNLHKIVEDALQDGGLVVNDCQLRSSIRWADDPWEWSLSGPGYAEMPHIVTVELGEPRGSVQQA